MKKIEDIIRECEIYVNSLDSKTNKDEFDIQYLEMGIEIKDLLNKLKNKEIERIPESFYMNLIDSFDIYSGFWKEFRIFQDSNTHFFGGCIFLISLNQNFWSHKLIASTISKIRRDLGADNRTSIPYVGPPPSVQNIF